MMRHRLAALIIAVAAASFAGAAHAQSAADTTADALIACLDIGDPEERLSCLEASAQALKAVRADEGEGLFSAQADASADAANDDLFGAEALASTKRAKREGRKSARLEAGVAELRVGPLKNVTVSLDNGQVWRQFEGDTTIVRPGKGDNAYTATVSKGAVGGYWMTINELDRRFRVKRIK